jgi:hypothetical protein
VRSPRRGCRGRAARAAKGLGQAGAPGAAAPDDAALKAQIGDLALRVLALEGVLQGITNGDLTGMLGRVSGRRHPCRPRQRRPDACRRRGQRRNRRRTPGSGRGRAGGRRNVCPDRSTHRSVQLRRLQHELRLETGRVKDQGGVHLMR